MVLKNCITHLRLPNIQKIFSLLLSLFLFSSYLFAQNTYESLISKADSLRKLQKYKLAIQYSETAIKEFHVKEYDYYSIARCYARISNEKEALRFLNLLYKLRSEYILKAPTDAFFTSLHTLNKWELLNEKITKFHDQLTNHRDSSIISNLIQIRKADQHYRLILDSLIRIGSKDEKLKGDISYKIEIVDSINIKSLSSIINKGGWPGINIAGEEGNLTAFLILQHSNVEIQKKYNHLVKSSMKQGFTPKYLYAYLEDRILVGEGKAQKYGTQLEFNSKTGKYEVMLLESAEKVNGLRRIVGLPPLQSYIDIINKK